MKVYIIEARKLDGSLDFADPQPETLFGRGAIVGMSEDEIAKVIFAKVPGVQLDGGCLPFWATAIDERFRIRQKTW